MDDGSVGFGAGEFEGVRPLRGRVSVDAGSRAGGQIRGDDRVSIGGDCSRRVGGSALAATPATAA